MKMLVHNIVWPAVAGSILWAFLQVAAEPEFADPTYLPRAIALLLVGIYLSDDWVDTEQKKDRIRSEYWKADMPLAFLLSLFAIATQLSKPWAPLTLGLAFITAATGHLLGAWDLEPEPSSRRMRAAFAGINMVGVLMLLLGWGMSQLFGWAISKTAFNWCVPASVVVVLGLYSVYREGLANASVAGETVQRTLA